MTVALRYRFGLMRRMAIGFLVAGLALGACGGSKSTSSSAKRAATLLEQALKAHTAGQIDRAKDLYGQVLKADKRNKFAIYNLGLIAQTRHDVKTAVTDYRKVLAIDAKYEPALYNLAILRAQAGANDEAIQLYRRAITAKPADAGAHLNLGLLLVATGHADEGDAEIATARRLDPSLGVATTTATTTTT